MVKEHVDDPSFGLILLAPDKMTAATPCSPLFLLSTRKPESRETKCATKPEPKGEMKEEEEEE